MKVIETSAMKPGCIGTARGIAMTEKSASI